MRAAGPSRLRILRDLPTIRRGLVEYLCRLVSDYGETVHLPLLSPTYLVTNPEDIRHILVVNPRNFHKAGGLVISKEVFGAGLVTSEAPLHSRQRRVMQPMFHRSSIARLASQMATTVSSRVSSWRTGQVVDLSLEMMDLTLVIASAALFSVDTETTARDLGAAFTTAQRLITRRQRKVPLPLWLPTPTNRRYKEAVARIDRLISGIIESRRKRSHQPQDLLTMLLEARFENDAAMSDQQLRDEISTMLFAGHETVSNHLTWTWYLLSRNPDIEARLVREWSSVLAGSPPALEQVSALTYTEMVLAESLRLLPPVWTLHRRAVERDQLPSGLSLHPGDELLISQYVSHRNSLYFADPETFRPERWTSDFKQSLPAGVYFPFSLGPRSCIGDNFARLEAVVLLTTIGQRFKVSLVEKDASKEALLTLRPRGGMRVTLQRR